MNYFKETFNWDFLFDYGRRINQKFPQNSQYAFWRKFSFFQADEVDINPSDSTSNLAKTNEAAIEHILSSKEKDPYSILCLDSNCTADQIRQHYKRLAILVHPDKNDLPEAEEAFKILQKAFDLIGEPGHRAAYHVELSRQESAAMTLNEFGNLLNELQEKIVQASNTIRCANCNGRHTKVPTDRHCYAARECRQCKIRHAAREGDIWAETRWFGLRWVYLACMDGHIYDISVWAACQKTALGHLTANSHNVQYRIVLGDRSIPRQRTHHNSTTFQDFINKITLTSSPSP